MPSLMHNAFQIKLEESTNITSCKGIKYKNIILCFCLLFFYNKLIFFIIERESLNRIESLNLMKIHYSFKPSLELLNIFKLHLKEKTQNTPEPSM